MLSFNLQLSAPLGSRIYRQECDQGSRRRGLPDRDVHAERSRHEVSGIPQDGGVNAERDEENAQGSAGIGSLPHIHKNRPGYWSDVLRS